MTKPQIRKLDKIIGNLELLQLEIDANDPTRDYLAGAKAALIAALRKSEGV